MPLSHNLFLITISFVHALRTSGDGSGALQPSEAETLFSIMDSVSSDQNWRAAYPSPCAAGQTWQGIECKMGNDNHLHVSRLNLGAFPNPSCQKTASFPSQIFLLPHLESVFFLGCFVHTRTSFSIPQGNLSNSLRQVSIISNPNLAGEIPPRISLLRELKTLSLSQNQITGSIPAEIFTLGSLINLDLSYNFLNGKLSPNLGSMKNLVVLDLSYNTLTGTIPVSIGDLTMLQKLDLSSNFLTGEIPDTVGKLSSLSFLALNNNRLRGRLPAGLFTLPNLQYFIMDDNPVYVMLPAEFGNLGKLQELRLANSGYFGEIPAGYSRLVNLTTLALQNNNLSGGIPAAIGEMKHLYHMNLSGNLLEGIVPFDDSFFKRLGRNLDLRENPGLCLGTPAAQHAEVRVCRRGDGSDTGARRKSSAPASDSAWKDGRVVRLCLYALLLLSLAN